MWSISREPARSAPRKMYSIEPPNLREEAEHGRVAAGLALEQAVDSPPVTPEKTLPRGAAACSAAAPGASASALPARRAAAERRIPRCSASPPRTAAAIRQVGSRDERRPCHRRRRRARCWWGASTPDYVAYHDEEWGRPVRDDRALYERLCLEAFQSGLSWLTILRKREAFRAAFAGFEIDAVAAFGDEDVERLMADAGIVRNRAKIEAAIANARAAAGARRPVATLLWSFAPGRRARRRATSADVPAVTPESTAMAKELKRRGFRFVGPTTAYALMQACGLVNDHLDGCLAR